jgi:hypothetical protein
VPGNKPQVSPAFITACQTADLKTYGAMAAFCKLHDTYPQKVLYWRRRAGIQTYVRVGARRRHSFIRSIAPDRLIDEARAAMRRPGPPPSLYVRPPNVQLRLDMYAIVAKWDRIFSGQVKELADRSPDEAYPVPDEFAVAQVARGSR